VTNKLGATLDEILAQGGILAALAETTGRGTDTGTGTWTTGDLGIADEIVACVNDSGRIDPRRIYAAGCSAGGLTAGTMLYLRSSYLAGVQLDSGGTLLKNQLEDPTHVPALIASHGSIAQDLVIVNFATLGADIAAQVSSAGGFAVECDHGGDHCGTPDHIRHAQWQFLMAHPFGIEPSPYANGLPQDFPSECSIARAR
jgi:poly(3-hydroxybutyrate) depolymerase